MRRPDAPAAAADPINAFVVLEPGTIDHLIGALVSYQRQRRVDGLGLDVQLADLVSGLAAARRCPPLTSIDVEAEAGHSGEQLLLTYTEAAGRLAISRRHLMRLIAQGRLRRVHLGAAARIHTDDLTDYTDRLREEPDGLRPPP